MGQKRAGDRSRADVGRIHETRHIAHGGGRRFAHVADRLVDLFAERPARYRLRSRTSDQMETAACVWRSPDTRRARSEEHTSELQSLMRISYAVFCLK